MEWDLGLRGLLYLGAMSIGLGALGRRDRLTYVRP